MTRTPLRIDDRRFNQLALGGMVTGFLLIVAAFVATIVSFSASQQSVELVRHTYQVVDEISKLEVQLERAETGRRGFLLSQSPYRLKVYSDNVRLAPETLDQRLLRCQAEVGEAARTLYEESEESRARRLARRPS